jgi:hypothetical protein
MVDESDIDEAVPLHSDCVNGVALATGTGLTVMVSVFELTTFEVRHVAVE